jgi:hypothetical protein
MRASVNQSSTVSPGFGVYASGTTMANAAQPAPTSPRTDTRNHTKGVKPNRTSYTTGVRSPRRRLCVSRRATAAILGPARAG